MPEMTHSTANREETTLTVEVEMMECLAELAVGIPLLVAGGSDRFLIWTGDTMVDRNDLEAQLRFVDETGNWSETEIQVVDEGLRTLHEEAETALIIRDSLDTDPGRLQQMEQPRFCIWNQLLDHLLGFRQRLHV